MGETQEKLKELEARRQELLSVEARAAANHERAKADLEAAQREFEALGFASVEDAKGWLETASVEITEMTSALDKTLTEAGV